jgi:hypothetical protein
MPAKSPEDICRLFQHYMAEGDIDSVLNLNIPEAVFQSAEITNGRHALRQELAPLAAMKARFDFDVRQVIQTGGIAELKLFRKNAEVVRMATRRPNKRLQRPECAAEAQSCASAWLLYSILRAAA